MMAAFENLTGHAAQISAGYDANVNVSLSSDEKAGDITLKAGKNIVLESAQANNSSFSRTTSVGASFGLSARRRNPGRYRGTDRRSEHIRG